MTGITSLLRAREISGRNNFPERGLAGKVITFSLNECLPAYLRDSIVVLGFSRCGERIVCYRPATMTLYMCDAGIPPVVRSANWRLRVVDPASEDQEDAQQQDELSVDFSPDSALCVVTTTPFDDDGFEEEGSEATCLMTVAPTLRGLRALGIRGAATFSAAQIRLYTCSDQRPSSAVSDEAMWRTADGQHIVVVNTSDSLRLLSISLGRPRAKRKLSTPSADVPLPSAKYVVAASESWWCSLVPLEVTPRVGSAGEMRAQGQPQPAPLRLPSAAAAAATAAATAASAGAAAGVEGARAEAAQGAAEVSAEVVATVEVEVEERNLDVEMFLAELHRRECSKDGAILDYLLQTVGTVGGGRHVAAALVMRVAGRAGALAPVAATAVGVVPTTFASTDLTFVLVIDIVSGDVAVLESTRRRPWTEKLAAACRGLRDVIIQREIRAAAGRAGAVASPPLHLDALCGGPEPSLNAASQRLDNSALLLGKSATVLMNPVYPIAITAGAG